MKNHNYPRFLPPTHSLTLTHSRVLGVLKFTEEECYCFHFTLRNHPNCGSLHMIPNLLLPISLLLRSVEARRSHPPPPPSVDLHMACFWIHRPKRPLDQCGSKHQPFPSVAALLWLWLCPRWSFGGYECGSPWFLFLACSSTSSQKCFRFVY